jgi:hypothetical protein
MGGQQGYSKIITNNLIFSYDTGDPVNSFKGKPTTNILTSIVDNQGTNTGTYFKTNYGSEISNIPGLGGNKTVRYCNIYNDYPNSGNCCPSLFLYGDFTTGVSANTQYVYQIIYKTQNGYASANYMYRYEYNGGTLVSETGVWDSSREEDLGNGWKHAWGIFTTSGTTTRLVCYSFHYEYATYNKLQIAGISITQGTSILRPRQFLGVGVTRSVTQGLLDLTRNRTIDLTNVSFDTSGSMIFDGTNDNINTGISNVGNNITYEAVAYCISNISSYNMFFGQFLPYIGFYGGTQIIFSDSINSTQQTILSSGGSVTTGKWYHIVCTRSYNGSSCTNTIYINSTQNGQNTFSGTYTESGDTINIGDGQSSDWYPFNGYVAVAKIYNRALTQSEISQNYNHYKTRFNLS